MEEREKSDYALTIHDNIQEEEEEEYEDEDEDED